MNGQHIVDVLETYGPYQRRLLLMLTLPLILSGYQSMMVIITMYTPEHRCKIPGLLNDTFAIQGEGHGMLVNRSIPTVTSGGVESYSQCRLYAHATSNSSTGSDVTEACNAWVYDESQFTNTMTTQFDLVCSHKGFRAHYNMLSMVGMLCFSLLAGYLCDRFGRKTMFTLSYAANIAMCVASAFPVVPEVILVYRFIQSGTLMTLYLSLYVLFLECTAASQRTFAGSMLMVVWVLGTFLVAGLSYLLTDWRHIHIAGAAPFALCLLYFRLLPESPRWLLSNGRVQQAKAVLAEVVRINKLTLLLDDTDMESLGNKVYPEVTKGNESKVSSNVDTVEDTTEDTNGHDLPGEKDGEQQKSLLPSAELAEKPDPGREEDRAGSKDEGEESVPTERLWHLLKYRNLVIRTGVIFFNWMVVSMTYYGLSLNVSNLGGSVRVNFLLSNGVELLGYCAAWGLLDRMGRKGVHCAAMLTAGLACLATILPVTLGEPGLSWVTTALAMVGKLGISAAFSSVYLVTAELFPTVIRNMGMGCSSTVARVGSAVSPYIADLALYVKGSFGPALPLIIFGACALTAGLLSLLLPETLNRKLPDTILDAVNFDRKPAELVNGKDAQPNYEAKKREAVV